METSYMGQAGFRPRAKTRRNSNRLRRMRTTLRVVSNAGLIAGQCVLLFASRDIGLAIIICSGLLSVPFFLKEKMWDVLCLIAFMQLINIVGLFIQ
jgi:hypothetical protein